jgi:hypothetical protein
MQTLRTSSSHEGMLWKHIGAAYVICVHIHKYIHRCIHRFICEVCKFVRSYYSILLYCMML